ncbi:MAG: hypothetical protein K1X67_23565 [Fimbriimonadaceae bacterium]|nr:hypothetical protein [Fimbriimonadaceae bacterium]
MRLGRALLLALLTLPSLAMAADFQLIATQTPPGGGGTWQSVLRYTIGGTGGSVTPLADIPAAQVADPASPAFRTGAELFIGNRHGNSGVGSISRFILHPDNTFTKTGDITGNGAINIHQICFNPVSGELFAGTVNTGISRFIFDSGGTAIPHGFHAIGPTRGVMVGRDGETLYVTRASGELLRYHLNANGTITQLPSVFPPGASNLHFMRVRFDGELYAADISSNKVFRYRFDALNNPVYVGFVTSNGAIDVTFSPDGQEMFVSDHFGGGIDRFLYQAGTDSWLYTATIPTTSLGGIAVHQEVNLPPGTVAGNINLQAFVGPVASQTVTMEILDQNTFAVLDSENVTLDAGGNYSFTTAARGTFRVAAKSSHWLRRQRPDTIVLDTTKGASGVNLSLRNGDIDEDNEVGIGDYAILSFAYNSSPGDPNWEPMADLNGDDAVDIADYAILSDSYGEAGD